MGPTLPPGIERRGHPRLALNLLCHLSAPGTKAARLSAWTVNISRSGVLLKLDGPGPWGDLPRVGAAVRLDVELPTHRYLRCHGRVVRVQSAESEPPRLALSVRRMEFCQNLRKPARAQEARWSQVKELLV